MAILKRRLLGCNPHSAPDPLAQVRQIHGILIRLSPFVNLGPLAFSHHSALYQIASRGRAAGGRVRTGALPGFSEHHFTSIEETQTQ